MCVSFVFLHKTFVHIVYDPRQRPSCTKVALETRTAVWSNWRCEGSQGSRATLSTKLRGIVRSSKGGFAVRPFRQVLQLALPSAYAFLLNIFDGDQNPEHSKYFLSDNGERGNKRACTSSLARLIYNFLRLYHLAIWSSSPLIQDCKARGSFDIKLIYKASPRTLSAL